ncbi:MAG TPA: Holliday junction resolvase RuvX [Bryobacteraceae bacterium]|nr:Holliday junction resolvase RuvX [Bryobacteraceae bacterium]
MNENNLQYPGRILALDLGRRRIGLAMSDELRITAQGLDTLARTSLRDDLAALTQLASDRGVSLIVIGNPIRLNGVEGAQSVWVREFASKLEACTGLPVRLWDERFTTVEAERVLRESGISREKRGRAVDRLAAVILLESYLGSIDTAAENAEA